jgi:hypothetical protein
MLPFRMIGKLLGWVGENAGKLSVAALPDRLQLNPLALAINLAIIAIIVIVTIFTHRSKGEGSGASRD